MLRRFVRIILLATVCISIVHVESYGHGGTHVPVLWSWDVSEGEPRMASVQVDIPVSIMKSGVFEKSGWSKNTAENFLGDLLQSECKVKIVGSSPSNKDTVQVRYRIACQERPILGFGAMWKAAGLRAIVQVREPQSKAQHLLVLDQSQDSILVPHHNQRSLWGTMGEQLWSGFVHILSGLDHVLFALGILLLTLQSKAQTLTSITVFTVAHASSIVLVSLGSMQVRERFVEPLIAFSVLLLGIEIVRRQVIKNVGEETGQKKAAGLILPILLLVFVFFLRAEWPLTIVFALLYIGLLVALAPIKTIGRGVQNLVILVFGLIHGVGFAGPLVLSLQPNNRIETGVQIIGFNLGIELGQIVVLLIGIWALVPLAIRGKILVWGDSESWVAAAIPGMFLVLIGAAWSINRVL